jgi:hypothetical protein
VAALWEPKLWVREYEFFSLFTSEAEAQAFERCWKRSRRIAARPAFAAFFHLGWVHDRGD